METIVLQNNDCCILRYPEQFQVQLVSKPHGNCCKQRESGLEEDESDELPTHLEHRRSRKRSHSNRSFNKGELLQQEYHMKIQDLLKSCYASLMECAQRLNYFPILSSSSGAMECSVDLASLCNIDSLVGTGKEEFQFLDLMEVKDAASKQNLDIVGKIVSNTGHCNIQMRCWDQLFLVPVGSSFLLSDISKVRLLADQVSASASALYKLIVIDPPWENRSAIRGRKYQWLDREEILQLPIRELLAEGGLVAVWVTNKQSLVEWVKGTLFPYWGLEFEAEWLWLKVTSEGEFVFPLDSFHKKPYEMLLIGQRNSHAKSCHKKRISESTHCTAAVVTNAVDKPSSSAAGVPNRYVFLCTPSLVHSQKPYLGDLLASFVPGDDGKVIKRLELFARNLLPGWMSWGNEVLKFQAISGPQSKDHSYV